MIGKTIKEVNEINGTYYPFYQDGKRYIEGLEIVFTDGTKVKIMADDDYESWFHEDSPRGGLTIEEQNHEK